MARNRVSPGKRFVVRSELETIGTAAAIHSGIIAGCNAERAKRGQGPVVDQEKIRRLQSLLVDAMRSAVTFKEIDAAARELYGDRFAGISICEAYKKAEALAFDRKGSRVRGDQ